MLFFAKKEMTELELYNKKNKYDSATYIDEEYQVFLRKRIFNKIDQNNGDTQIN